MPLIDIAESSELADSISIVWITSHAVKFALIERKIEEVEKDHF